MEYKLILLMTFSKVCQIQCTILKGDGNILKIFYSNFIQFNSKNVIVLKDVL